MDHCPSSTSYNTVRRRQYLRLAQPQREHAAGDGDLATVDANAPPATSIWLSSQPPKMSPWPLVSAGIASVRMQRSPQVDSIAALAAGRADLAIARTDEAMPDGTMSVAIMRKNIVALWAPTESPRRALR